MHFKGALTICRSSLKFNACPYRGNMMDCLETFDSFVAAGVEEVFWFFSISFARTFIWHRETDSKLFSADYKGLIVGKKTSRKIGL